MRRSRRSSKGRSPSVRHISRTHCVNLDWLFDGINLDPGIQIKCVNTSKQIADILTKVSFPSERRTQLTQLFIFDDTAHAVLQPFSGVFIYTGRRQDVEVSSRTFDGKRHHQTMAGAQPARSQPLLINFVIKLHQSHWQGEILSKMRTELTHKTKCRKRNPGKNTLGLFGTERSIG